MRVWRDTLVLDSFFIEKAGEFPVGIYELLSGAEGVRVVYPNAFYKEKLGLGAVRREWRLAVGDTLESPWWQQAAGKVVWVMPEEPCFACPHWMAEVYSRLERKNKGGEGGGMLLR